MHFTATFRANPPPQAAGMDVDELPAAGTRPDRLVVVRPQERVQRHTVEHIVDSAPVVPSLDAPVPLMAEQLVDVLSLVAEYETEMDRLEDRILQGSPVSTADREAWASLGEQLLFLRIEEEEKRRGGRGSCRKPVGGQG